MFIVGFEYGVVSMLPLATQLVDSAPGKGFGLVIGVGTFGRGVLTIVATTLYEDHGIAGAALSGIACAVLSAVAIDRRRIEQANARQLDTLRGVPGVRAVRQLGTVAAVELEAPSGYLSDIGRELAAFAIAQGVLIRPLGNVAYCLPPYCTSDDELDRVYTVLHRFLSGERAAPIGSGGPIDD